MIQIDNPSLNEFVIIMMKYHR